MKYLDNPNLVKKVNELFHDWEVGKYEKHHPEILKYEQENWDRILDRYLSTDKEVPKKILDIGTGTGFVADLIAKRLGSQDELFCNDISEKMLWAAQKNLLDKNYHNKFYFIKGALEESTGLIEKSFDLITINSVLHHIAELDTFFKKTDDLLKPGGKLVIMHEPNQNFFNNFFLRENFIFLRKMRELRFKLKNRNKNKVKENTDIYEEINKELKKESLIENDLSFLEIKQLVDYGSPTAGKTIAKKKGFDVEKIKQAFLSDYEATEWFSYNYLGKINYHSNFILCFYNFILSKVFPKKGSSWGAVFKKNDTKNQRFI